MSCPYANLFGAPGQGAHAVRFGKFGRFPGFAVIDTLCTLVLICLTTYVTGYSIWLVAVFWFILGEIVHYAFGTQTAFLTLIGVKAC
jgi:hypothetical protein